MNSIYNPLGFTAPVTIRGKAILRELTQSNSDWHSPLPQEMEETWIKWRSSLEDRSNLQVSRSYTEISSPEVSKRVLIVFRDASIGAIATIDYLKLPEIKGAIHVGFVMGKAKLTSIPANTAHRLSVGLERVQGLIREAELQCEEKKKPIVIHGKHHIATLLTRYYHQKTQHQERLFTEGTM